MYSLFSIDFACLSLLKRLLKDGWSNELAIRTAEACGLSVEPLKKFVNGDVDGLIEELKRDNSEFARKLLEIEDSFKSTTGRSFIKSLYDGITLMKSGKDKSISELLTLFMSAFGVDINHVKLLDIIECIRESDGVVYIDKKCKNEKTRGLSKEEVELIDSFEKSLGVVSFVAQELR